MSKSSAANRPVPLFDRVDHRPAAPAFHRRLHRVAALTGLSIVCLGVTIVMPPPPRLVWNASASAPIGLYAVSPGKQPVRGELAVAWPPDEARQLASRRHYLPSNVPLVKRVAAVSGDRICATGVKLTVNGALVAVRHVADARGRPLPAWHGCARLGEGQLLLLMAQSHDSFDGRYFGPTSARDVIGRAVPLWLR